MPVRATTTGETAAFALRAPNSDIRIPRLQRINLRRWETYRGMINFSFSMTFTARR